MTNCAAHESYEISPRFQRTVEERIARLERDAAADEYVSMSSTESHRNERLSTMQRPPNATPLAILTNGTNQGMVANIAREYSD